jgi:phosphoglycolate phosphatase-like HAD superfamily hydrolase
MTRQHMDRASLIILALLVSLTKLPVFPVHAQPGAPLASWNEGAAKQAIVRFVSEAVRQGGPQFVDPRQRIAVFDNDGTLWCEQPIYVQLAFALDRVKALAPAHPEWTTTEPVASILKGDIKTALAGGERAAGAILAATHSGMTTEEFHSTVSAWVGSARHPKTGRRYTEMVYQPMLELLAYLRANGFKTFIVSGGGTDFMRPWTETVYGIPPEQVIGSSGKTRFELRDGKPILLRLPEIEFIDDKEGKPAAIHRFIGSRPILAVGNSDGDQQMLEWTAGGSGPRLNVLVHHTDAEREFQYDRASSIGRLDKALDEAIAQRWTIVSMKDDWKTVFAQ